MQIYLHPSRSAVRLFLAAIGLAMTGLLASCTERSVVTEASANPTTVTDYDVQMLDAPSIKLSELTAQNKVFVLDFWATWCGPCRMEIPYLVELQKDYKDKGVEVIGLSTEDPRVDAAKVRAFAKEMNINYQLGFASGQMFNAMTFGSQSIPQTMIFDRHGKLVKHIRGIPRFNPASIRDHLREAVDKALAQS